MAMQAWQNTIKDMIVLGQLTPAQEAIFQAHQPNGCCYHCTDSYPSNATLTSPGFHTLNIFKAQRCQNQEQGGRGGGNGSRGGPVDGGRGSCGRGQGYYQRQPPPINLQ
eukprot:10277371-Ditylum_brightwellii.AAC.1